MVIAKLGTRISKQVAFGEELPDIGDELVKLRRQMRINRAKKTSPREKLKKFTDPIIDKVADRVEDALREQSEGLDETISRLRQRAEDRTIRPVERLVDAATEALDRGPRTGVGSGQERITTFVESLKKSKRR